MSAIARRLSTLETVWNRPAAFTPDDASFLRFWSRPCLLGVFWQFCMKRAEERFIAEERGGRYGGQTDTDPCWYTGAVTEDERRARAQFESDELDRLQRSLGDAEGWDAWHAQAAEWPQKYGRVDAGAVVEHLRHTWSVADSNRACNPNFAVAWPEWRRDASFKDQLAFDSLLAEEAERVDRFLASVGLADAVVD